MISRNIFLSDVDDVMEFVHQTEMCSYDIEIFVGDSVINAKSIMGLLSKGFRRMMQMNIHADKADELLEKIGRFCVWTSKIPLTNDDQIDTIMNIDKSCEKNKYLSWELTESRRLMRGAREYESEYILELRIEICVLDFADIQ